MAAADDLVPRTTARGGRSPTVETVAVVVAVFLLQVPLTALGLLGLFVLDPAFVVKPWTLLTATYAHAGPGHLVGNLVPLLLFGFAVERVTTRWRYHAFFVVTGALAGLAEVVLGGLVSLSATGVLGASGAVFALMGYAVTGNDAAGWALEALDSVTDSEWAVTTVLVALAVVVAVALSGPGSALIAHLVGFLLGLGAGRLRLLHVDRRE
ncbi:rhomboid family intramembrane serine protease [Halobaculum sp. MBLA0147]|uniref:rhomboid family intramembrane serine protease n=1 Tax=Halobaculum sp. MBLA0147 TaxID=3079934 RepID=UPI003523902F